MHVQQQVASVLSNVTCLTAYTLHAGPTVKGTSGVTRVAMTTASVSASLVMIATSCSGDLPGPQMTSGNPVLAARHVSTYSPAASR